MIGNNAIKCTTTASSGTSISSSKDSENNNDNNNNRISSFWTPETLLVSNYTVEVDSYFNNKSDNTTNYTLGDEVVMRRSHLATSVICIICILIIVMTIIGNSLVVLAVTIVRKLHTEDNANNYLLVSLAVSDFLVGMLVMPFALYVELKEGNK